MDAVLSLAGLLIFRAPRNCLREARHGCDLGFGSGIARGYAILGQIDFSESSMTMRLPAEFFEDRQVKLPPIRLYQVPSPDIPDQRFVILAQGINRDVR